MAWRKGRPELGKSAAARVKASGAVPEPSSRTAVDGIAAAATATKPAKTATGAGSRSRADQQVLGAHVRVRTAGGKVVEGELFAVSGGMAVIREVQAHTFVRANVHLLSLSRVTHVRVLGRVKAALPADAELPSMDSDVIKARQASVERRLRAGLSAVGEGVSHEGQMVFNHLQRVLTQCKWDGKCVVVHGMVRVDPPYAADNAAIATESESSQSRMTLSMVKGQLTRFWDKGGGEGAA